MRVVARANPSRTSSLLLPSTGVGCSSWPVTSVTTGLAGLAGLPGLRRGIFFSRHVIRDGTWAAIHHRNGKIETIQGPKYLRIHDRRSWNVEYVPGPAHRLEDALGQESVAVFTAESLNSGEAMVIYDRPEGQQQQQQSRRILRGPILYFPKTVTEWVHKFEWHGTGFSTDDRRNQRKVPEALQFSKLRTTPDSMYHTVRSVRTKDDARIKVELMLFYELLDIERMLDTTHDPTGEMITTVEADVVDFVGSFTFEGFKCAIGSLNDLDTYKSLTAKALAMGYRITRMAMRSYSPEDERLVDMHAEALSERTSMMLKQEKQLKVEEAKDAELAKEKERMAKRHEMELQEREHKLKVAKQEALCREVELGCKVREDQVHHQQRLAREDAQSKQDAEVGLRRVEHELRVAKLEASRKEFEVQCQVNEAKVRHLQKLDEQETQFQQRVKHHQTMCSDELAFLEKLKDTCDVDINTWFQVRETRLPPRIENLSVFGHPLSLGSTVLGQPIQPIHPMQTYPVHRPQETKSDDDDE